MKKTLLFTSFCLFVLSLSAMLIGNAATVQFSDIDGHKYEDAIEFIAEKGIVSGYADQTFRPENNITRSELIKIVLEGNFEGPFVAKSCFPDVKVGNWFSKYVCEAKDKGIIQGYPDGTFKPDQDVSFVEALKILQVAYGIEFETDNPWYKDSVLKASEIDIIPLDITSFDMSISRGQMAEMLARLINYESGDLSDFLGYKSTCGRTTYDTIAHGIKVELNCYSVQNPVLTADALEKGLLKSKYTCGACDSDQKCENGKCINLPLTNTNFCGNYKLESGEKFLGDASMLLDNTDKNNCYWDVNAPCRGDNCNEYATVECACDEFDVLSQRHGCIANAEECSSCGVQEDLFPAVLDMQTDVIECLSDYFEYQPHRLIYKVYNNPNLEECPYAGGCTGIEGGVGGADYVLFHNLNGYREDGQVVPTRASYVTADVHETTHYFVYQMLHVAPDWFHEAIAIQTNERLDCSKMQMPDGDAYLSEREGDTGKSGINMDDGTFLSTDFYERLKSGETSLSLTETNAHIIGTLYIIGLKEDYKCGANCVKDIVIKLRELEQEYCREGSDECMLNAVENNGWEEKINDRVKDVTDDVTGKDTQPLFTLLGI